MFSKFVEGWPFTKKASIISIGFGLGAGLLFGFICIQIGIAAFIVVTMLGLFTLVVD